MIVEFDGSPHYDSPQKIRDDETATKFYESIGYKVVQIPFFIQLTNKSVRQLFYVEVEEPMFNESIPSMGPKGINLASIRGTVIMRMAKKFKKSPEQYAVNSEYLKAANDEYLTGAELLEIIYGKE